MKSFSTYLLEKEYHNNGVDFYLVSQKNFQEASKILLERRDQFTHSQRMFTVLHNAGLKIYQKAHYFDRGPDGDALEEVVYDGTNYDQFGLMEKKVQKLNEETRRYNKTIDKELKALIGTNRVFKVQGGPLSTNPEETHWEKWDRNLDATLIEDEELIKKIQEIQSKRKGEISCFANVASGIDESYVGTPRDAWFYVKKLGLSQIQNRENIKEHGSNIGFSESKQAWAGWSHRALVHFTIGDMIFEEKFGDDTTPFIKHGSKVIKTLEDAKLSAGRFAASVS